MRSMKIKIAAVALAATTLFASYPAFAAHEAVSVKTDLGKVALMTAYPASTRSISVALSSKVTKPTKSRYAVTGITVNVKSAKYGIVGLSKTSASTFKLSLNSNAGKAGASATVVSVPYSYVKQTKSGSSVKKTTKKDSLSFLVYMNTKKQGGKFVTSIVDVDPYVW